MFDKFFDRLFNGSNEKEIKKIETEQDVLAQYNAQTQDSDDTHFYHVDGYYGDYSDSCC